MGASEELPIVPKCVIHVAIPMLLCIRVACVRYGCERGTALCTYVLVKMIMICDDLDTACACVSLALIKILSESDRSSFKTLSFK